MDFKNIQIVVLAVIFGLQFLVEHMYPQRKEVNNWKNERFNLAIGFLNVLLSLAPAYFITQLTSIIETNKLGLYNQLDIAMWLKVLLSVFVLDFWLYAWHIMNHKISFLWHFHKFHHKDNKMNTSTALRFHFAELFFSYPGKALVCFVFGIGYFPLIMYEMLFFTSIVFHHSNIFISLRADSIYRILFVSPRMHRIHHSIEVKETNSNFGALFSFWDKLFQSNIHLPSGEIVFGLPNEIKKPII